MTAIGLDVRRFLIELFSLLSRGLNVLTGGTADMTFSARVHFCGWTRAEAVIDGFFWWAFKEEAHCAVWFRKDIDRARALEDEYLRRGVM